MRSSSLSRAIVVCSAVAWAAACSSSSTDDPGLDPITGATAGKAGASGASGKAGAASGAGAPSSAGGAGAGGAQASGGAAGAQTGGGAAGAEAGSPGASGAAGDPFANSGGSGGSAGGSACADVPGVDDDQDGWTEAEGDCNDCSASVNPGALEVVNCEKSDCSTGPLPDAQQLDDDCDGKVMKAGDVAPACDADLQVKPGIDSAFDAARAIGLCNVKIQPTPADKKERKWGVLEAKFVRLNSAALAGQDKPYDTRDFGILPNFGPATAAKEGKMLLALSTGVARLKGQPDYTPFECNIGGSISKSGGVPFPNVGTWPKQGTCPGTGSPMDASVLDLKVRVPTNAKSMGFSMRFFSCEFPMYVCSSYNDVLAVLALPLAGADSNTLLVNGVRTPTAQVLAASDPMYPDVAFETAGTAKNVIGVNNQSFFTTCEPGAATGYNNCKGDADLAGSGFEKHAASGWLSTTFPVTPGGVYVFRIAIWDSSDQLLDSSAVLDAVRFSTKGTDRSETVVNP
ncbi:MAG: putative metal-binding motif-containing protein [Polyangiaceae bacterium]|nr:putative metal-binding motif-containing protein [Polyangiaceae bacterium]